MYIIELYQKSSGRIPLEKFFSKIDKGGDGLEYARLLNAINKLEKYGRDTNKYDKKLVKHLQGDLFELRPEPNRVFFFYFDGNTIVLLHGFKKDSQKTPKKEIDLALQEMDDYKRRHNDGTTSNIRPNDRGNQTQGRERKRKH